MSENKLCSCPKCNNSGESVASIHYNQTNVWDKDGTFSGIGFGLTSSGPGVGFGVGGYSESGVSQTKIAKTFEEPKKVNNLGAVLLILFVAFIAISMAPSVLESVGEPSKLIVHQDKATTFNEFLKTDMNKLMFGILPIALLGLGIHLIFKTMKRDEKYNSKVYPKKVERFNQLRYCKNCNIIFDDSGKYEVASEYGFNKMLTNV